MKNIFGLCFCLSVLALVGCGKDDETNTEINNPTTYNFTRDGQSTVSFPGQTTRIAMGTELINAMANFNQSAIGLLEMYANETATGEDANPYANDELNASSKSIKSKTAASTDFFSANTSESATIKADFETWITAQVTEVFPNKNELATPGFAGQIADGSSVRYVNAAGLEYNQVVNKGLIGALIVDQILNNYLSPTVLDAGENKTNNDAGIVDEGSVYTTMEHKWDEAYGYLFGASTDATNPIATLGEGNFLNKYLSRVNDDVDFAGIATDIWEAFKLGRAAIVAGDYDERNDQASIIKELISKAMAIRTVYYLQQGKNALPTSGDNYGSAFHDLSEGAGFVYSLRFLRNPNNADAYFSRSEVDAMMEQLTTGNGFWEITPATLDAMSEEIANKFDFTVAQAGS